MVRNEYSVKVRWSEADPAGIVFYPRFFEWFDLATEALFESVGLPWPELFPKFGIVGVPIVESGARFQSPVRYGDVVQRRLRGGRREATRHFEWSTRSRSATSTAPPASRCARGWPGPNRREAGSGPARFRRRWPPGSREAPAAAARRRNEFVECRCPMR